MNPAVYVEGDSDKPVFRRVVDILVGRVNVPVRAGYGPYRGDALLSKLGAIAKVCDREKLIVILDADKRSAVSRMFANGMAIRGKRICLLVGDWQGLETLMRSLLRDRDRTKYEEDLRRFGKKLAAANHAGMIDDDLVRANAWMRATLVPSLECKCPESTVLC